MPSEIADGPPADQSGTCGERPLSELVAARICHDLVSPVGAIGNGLDLLRELGAGPADDLDLIAESAARAAAILRLHRLAFGPQPTDGERYGRAALAARLRPVIASRRVALEIRNLEGPDLAPGTSRLVALMALAGRRLVGAEGHLVMALAPAGDLPVSVAAEGRRAAWEPHLEALARGHATAETSSQVEFALLPIVARAAGARIETRSEPERARLDALAA